MSLMGPRPLLVAYLPRYNEFQRHRHDVRPGLTGYAQAHGRNTVSWEDKFAMDVFVHQQNVRKHLIKRALFFLELMRRDYYSLLILQLK